MSLPEHLRQLAVTGLQSDENELVAVLTAAADEIEIFHRYWNFAEGVKKLAELIDIRLDSQARHYQDDGGQS